MQLVLASRSPRRLGVLRQLGLSPLVRAPDVDESYVVGETPAEHVERLARAKAEAIRSDLSETLVIGGDTVVLDAGRVLGKPAGAVEAEAMLLALAGREHEVLSGIALAGSRGVFSTCALTRVRMRDYDAQTVKGYVATGEPLDKAGAYGIQGRGAALVESIAGDYYSVVGFPVAAFLELLERAGWRYDFAALARIAD